MSRTPFDVLNTATGNGATPLHMAVNNGGHVALIKAGSAALRCSVGPAGATFGEEGKPVRHSGGGFRGDGERVGGWAGKAGLAGGMSVSGVSLVGVVVREGPRARPATPILKCP